MVNNWVRGQAEAPADDDHVPWSRPPGMAIVTPRPGLSRRGPARAGPACVQEPERADARLRPERLMGRAEGLSMDKADRISTGEAAKNEE